VAALACSCSVPLTPEPSARMSPWCAVWGVPALPLHAFAASACAALAQVYPSLVEPVGPSGGTQGRPAGEPHRMRFPATSTQVGTCPCCCPGLSQGSR